MKMNNGITQIQGTIRRAFLLYKGSRLVLKVFFFDFEQIMGIWLRSNSVTTTPVVAPLSAVTAIVSLI